MNDDDIEYLTEALHTNLTAVAEEVGAIQEGKSDEMKTLGAMLSGSTDPEKALEEREDGPDSISEQFVESVKLSLLIADAADVPAEKLEGSGREKATPALKSLGEALGGR